MVGWVLIVATRIVMMLLKMPTVILSGPSEPIIEVVRPIPRGLDISWRTDVTSKQDKYIVVYTRNDTGQAVNIETTKMLTQLRDLYPGAGYKIQVRLQTHLPSCHYQVLPKVLAVSHNLQSEPQTSYTAVLPNPARNLRLREL